MLLAKQGPLSKQPELRTMLMRNLRKNPIMWLHGARFYSYLCTGQTQQTCEVFEKGYVPLRPLRAFISRIS